MRPLWRRWPTVLAIIAFLLNVDLVVMPVLTWAWGIRPGWTMFWIAAFFATWETTYWNWYAKWVVRNVQKTERVRNTTAAFHRQGIRDQVKEFAQRKFDWFVEHARVHAGDGGNERLQQGAVAFIRGTHIVMTYPLMFGLGCFPSGWPVAIFVQRIYPLPGAFLLFLGANACKTYALGLLYLWLPWWGKILVFVGAILLISFGTREIIRKVSALKAQK